MVPKAKALTTGGWQWETGTGTSRRGGLLDEVIALNESGKRALARTLKETIPTELMHARCEVAPTRCPHCGGERIVRKGKDRDGKQ